MDNNRNQDNSWLEIIVSWYVVSVILFVIFICCVTSCSPKIVYRTETKIEYRDRTVHDTATVEIPLIIEKNVTKDTVSRLENKYAKSDALVSGGLLHHSLESKPQIIEVPVEVTVTDTLWKESQVIEKEVKVEKELNWWQKFRMNAFPWLVLSVLLLLAWTFRKLIIKI